MSNELKVGDIITAYSPGLHVIEKIETSTHKLVYGGSSTTTIVFYKKVADINGKPAKSKAIKTCNIDWCKKVTAKSIQDLIDTKEKEIDTLREFALKNLVS